MPFASSSRSTSGGRRLVLLGLCALLLAIVAGGAGPAAGSQAPLAQVESLRIAEAPLGPREQRKLRASSWQGGTYTSSTGEIVRVLVSDSIPDGSALGQRWADFFTSLLHGAELGRMTAYIVTPDEMAYLCGPYALGCYGGGEMAITTETFGGVTPEMVATHEYGHHVAANRLNPPWLAIDWGTKRWASQVNVCLRAKQRTAFPGDEDENYQRNPGEAFAETYRVLNELQDGTTTFSWPIVDPSFTPDAAALEAARLDVVEPWGAPVTQSLRGRFTARGRGVWTANVPTPLDGTIAISLAFPKTALYELTLTSPSGNVLGTGLWSARGEKRLTTTVCGERSVVLRVTRRGSAGRFSVRVTRD